MSKGDAQMFLYLSDYGYKVSKNKDFLFKSNFNRRLQETKESSNGLGRIFCKTLL